MTDCRGEHHFHCKWWGVSLTANELRSHLPGPFIGPLHTSSNPRGFAAGAPRAERVSDGWRLPPPRARGGADRRSRWRSLAAARRANRQSAPVGTAPHLDRHGASILTIRAFTNMM